MAHDHACTDPKHHVHDGNGFVQAGGQEFFLEPNATYELLERQSDAGARGPSRLPEAITSVGTFGDPKDQQDEVAHQEAAQPVAAQIVASVVANRTGSTPNLKVAVRQ